MQQPRLITALATPFSNDQVDIEGLKENIAYQIESGVEGILVLGTTGESPTLSLSERRAVIKAATQSAKNKVPVMVGTGANCTKSTIEYTKEAQELGANSALIVTPYYNCPMQEGVYKHFEAVVNATHIPICVYNHPKRTSVNITVDTLKKIAALEGVFGVKDVSGDLTQVARIIHEISSKHKNFCVWAGDDIATIPMMSIGAKGVISVASNVAPVQMSQMVHKASLGRYHEAQDQLYQLLPLFNALFSETNPIGIKAAMKLCSMPSGGVRMPLTEMSDENLALLQKAIEKLNIASFALHGG